MDVTPWLLVGWCGLDLVIGVAVSVLLILYQTSEGVTVSHPGYVLAMYATYGGGGALVG